MRRNLFEEGFILLNQEKYGQVVLEYAEKIKYCRKYSVNQSACCLITVTRAGGRLVKEGKYEKGYFEEQLVDASEKLLRNYAFSNNIQWVTNVPSLKRPELVRTFARQLAARLKLEYRDAIEKKVHIKYQKEIESSYLQYQNVNDSVEVREAEVLPKNVLLVDDMVDSKWTFTVLGEYQALAYGGGVS